MRFAFLAFTLIFVLAICHAEPREINKKCYVARTCIHGGNEKCGVDSKGNYRRFYDSCDLLEYNCLYNTDFIKTPNYKCNDLPDIDNKNDVKTENNQNITKTNKSKL